MLDWLMGSSGAGSAAWESESGDAAADLAPGWGGDGWGRGLVLVDDLVSVLVIC